MADAQRRRRSGGRGYDGYMPNHVGNGYGNNYIDGNTARQLNAVPKRKEEDAPERAGRKRIRRLPVSMPGIDGASFAFMTIALCAVILTAFMYIQSQNQTRGMKSEIISLQTEIDELEEENDVKYNQILAEVDLSDIYRRATRKLHMVMADGNKVYSYKSKKGDVVKQHADIPGAAQGR